MKTKVLLGVVGLVVLTFLLPLNSSAAPTVWRMQVSTPSTSLMYKFYTKFADQIAKRSQNRLQIKLFPSYGLEYKKADSLLAVKDGLVEAVTDYASHWAGVVPILGAGNLPLFYSGDQDHVVGLKVLKPVYAKALKKFNAKLMMLEGLPLVYLFARTPFTKVEDFKGRKIRVSAKPVMAALTKMGASPQTIALAEAITAMRTGVIDGQIWSIRAGLTYKIYDVVHYASAWPFYGVESATIINADAFKKQPPDIQKILEETAKEVEQDLIQNVVLRGGEADVKSMKATKKMEFVIPQKGAIAKARQISKSVWDAWVKKVGPAGQEAINMVDKALGR